MVEPSCYDCGQPAPVPLYDSLADLVAHVRGRCPLCSVYGRKQQRLPLEGA